MLWQRCDCALLEKVHVSSSQDANETRTLSWTLREESKRIE